MADTEISALPAVTALLGTTITNVVEDPGGGGEVDKKATVAQLAAFGPSAPTVVSVGAEFSSTGVPTATLPGTHAAGDILLLVLQTGGEADIAPPTGYARVGPQNGVGAAATAGSTCLAIFWKRHTGSESAPTLTDTGDHTYGVMLAIRGCIAEGDPFHLLGNAAKFSASTTGTSAKGRTSVDNCLVMAIFAHAVDQVGPNASAPANPSLASVTENFDDSTTDGIGGGIAIVSGVEVKAGPVDATTLTWATSSVDVSTLIAFIPAGVNPNHTMARAPEIQTFIATPTLKDLVWAKPHGAQSVRVQLCDGGGSGSSGNTTTTPAGGGGGGGGGYDEATFRADDLAATVICRPGPGGAAPTALNQAGNAGVVSYFDAGPLRSTNRIAGAAATAAASADGGNGGCGSGIGTVSVGVSTVRRHLNDGAATRAAGMCGAPGGSGTTAPIGGSEADGGGGGGESGGDTDAAITSANNGNSMRGGGGGGGGRTNTLVSGPGRGGGADAPAAVQGAAGTDSTRLPYGGSGGCAGGSTTAAGGAGGFPGGGGGGGGGVAGGFGGRGGHGCIVVTTHF